MIKNLLNTNLKTIVITNRNKLNKIKKFVFDNNYLHCFNFKTFEEVAKEIIGQIDYDGLFSFCKDNHLTFDVGYIYLDSSLIVNTVINDKIEKLLDIKNKYIKQSSLNDNLKYYQNKKIIILDDYKLNNQFNLAISKIKEVANEVIELFDHQEVESKISIFSFKTEKEEVDYLVKEIAQLISQGFDANKIKINKLPNNYYPLLIEKFNLHNIDIDLGDNFSLFENEITKNFLSLLKSMLNNDSLISFKKTIDDLYLIYKDEKELRIINQIINSINKIIFLEKELTINLYNLIIFKLKNTYIKKDNYTNIIKFIDLFNDVIEEDDIIFIPSFNQDIIPITYKDDNYLSDKELDEIGLQTSIQKNKNLRTKILNKISSFKNVFISYSLKGSDGVKVKSSLLSKLEKKYNVFSNKFSNDNNVTYSKNNDLIELAKMMDVYYKYGHQDDKLYHFYNNYSNIKYRKYSHKFTGVNKAVLENYLQNSFNLSYTSIDKYFKCGFAFYLEKILKIKRQTNEESLYVGNLFHYVLNKLFEKDEIDAREIINNSVLEFIKNEDNSLTYKELYFIEKYKERLLSLYSEIKRQHSNTKFKILGLEKELNIEINKKYKVKLSGVIDKVLCYKYAGSDYAVVVDYKTGSTDFDLNRIFYGINMQIMVYFYLLNDGDTNNIKYKFGGGYLQGVLPSSSFKKDEKKSYQEQEIAYLKLDGFSNKNNYLIKDIDDKIGLDESFINKIKFNIDSTYSANSQKHLIDDNQYIGMLELTKGKIEEAIDNIIEGKFAINPIKIQNKIHSCSFCPYSDICFKDDNDVTELKEFTNFSFLGGDE